MRGLAAGLLAVLCFGGLSTMAACSDTSDGGSGGAGGTPAAAGSGGKASTAGGTSMAGTGGGGVECGFAKPSCNECLVDNCGDELNGCADAGNCVSDLMALPNCVCVPTNDAETCIHDFVEQNGDPAQKVAECYTLNCEDACK